MTKRIPRVTNKLILKFWRSRMDTADMAKRLGIAESEIVKILEKARDDEKNRNKDRKATKHQSTVESVQGWNGVSVARVHWLEKDSNVGDRRAI